jgi:hypothetical protein
LAEEYLKKALPSVFRRQNEDGSWGRKEKETSSFLVLDASRTPATFLWKIVINIEYHGLA